MNVPLVVHDHYLLLRKIINHRFYLFLKGKLKLGMYVSKHRMLNFIFFLFYCAMSNFLHVAQKCCVCNTEKGFKFLAKFLDA
jgi:hypothetical protein